MTPRDIITEAAKKLDVELTDETSEMMLRCFEVVYDDLATYYYRLTDKAKVPVTEDGIYYIDFPKDPMRILDIDGLKKSEYGFHPDRIVLRDPVPGSYVTITYEYHPEVDGLDYEIEYADFVRDALIVGLCSEYCIREGLWELAYQYDQYYHYEIRNHKLIYEAGEYLEKHR